MISIIIPTCDQTGNRIISLLASLTSTTVGIDKEIIVVANGASKDIMEWCDMYGAELIYIRDRVGYPRAVNAGIGMSKGDKIVLLNDDVTLTKSGWLEKLSEAIDDPLVSFAGPWLFGHSWEWGGENYGNLYAIGFWCVIFRRSLINEIGLLDNYFYPGGCEDADICLRADFAGYRCKYVECDEVKHEGGQTFTEHHPDYFFGGWYLFYKKWSKPLFFYNIRNFPDDRTPSEKTRDRFHFYDLNKLGILWE